MDGKVLCGECNEYTDYVLGNGRIQPLCLSCWSAKGYGDAPKCLECSNEVDGTYYHWPKCTGCGFGMLGNKNTVGGDTPPLYVIERCCGIELCEVCRK